MFYDYNARAIPFVILVDTNGVIRYTGHPFYLKAEQEIDRLLKGEQINDLSKKEVDVKFDLPNGIDLN